MLPNINTMKLQAKQSKPDLNVSLLHTNLHNM